MSSLHPIFNYFDYDKINNKSTCKINGCKSLAYKGRHANNLYQHIDKKHRELRNELNEKRELYLNRRSRVTKRPKISAVNVKIDRSELLLGCMEMATVNGRPFTLFEDSGFQRIVRPIVQEFRSNNMPIQIYPEYIKIKAKEMQDIVKKQIKFEMSGKLLSLQLDLTKHLQRCILGINVQYHVDEHLVVRTLAMRRLLTDTSAISLAMHVRDVLEQFGAGIDDIYTISTDNGPNVIACTSTLRIMQEGATEEYLASCSKDNFDQTHLDNLIETESNRIAQGQELHFLHEVRCCTHVLQLAIGDVLDTDPLKRILPEYRAIVVNLRAPNVYNLLVTKGLKKPILDVDVRWSTVYAMVRDKSDH